MGYAKQLPDDTKGNPLYDNPPPRTALQIFGGASQVSSVITFDDNATDLEVTAIGGTGVVIKWIPTTDTQASVIATGASANFDHAVPANWVRRFTIPVEGKAVASIVGANIKNGLYRRVAWISAAGPASSIMGTTY